MRRRRLLDSLWLVSAARRSYSGEPERPDKPMQSTIAFGACSLSASCSTPRHCQGVGDQERKASAHVLPLIQKCVTGKLALRAPASRYIKSSGCLPMGIQSRTCSKNIPRSCEKTSWRASTMPRHWPKSMQRLLKSCRARHEDPRRREYPPGSMAGAAHARVEQ
jgi:hypothetical protein